MFKSLLFDKTYNLLEKSLDVSARRNNLLSSNIANIDTVGYKPKDLDFQKTLKKEMENRNPDFLFSTNLKHFKLGKKLDPVPGITKETEEGVYYNPDPVDIDKEMADIAENNIKYRTSVEILLRKIGTLRQAITEGGR